MYAIDDTAGPEVDDSFANTLKGNCMSNRRTSFFFTAIMLSACAAANAREIPQPYGFQAPAESAQREVRIGPTTRYVNVDRTETVRFVTDDGTFAWNFDIAPNRHVFDFSQIAPAARQASGVRVYVGEPGGDR
jgi:hypothetical protein